MFFTHIEELGSPALDRIRAVKYRKGVRDALLRLRTEYLDQLRLKNKNRSERNLARFRWRSRFSEVEERDGDSVGPAPTNYPLELDPISVVIIRVFI